MIRHSQSDHLRDRIAYQDWLSTTVADRADREIHASLAEYYRGELVRVQTEQVRRFAGFATLGGLRSVG
jgi:hypothetical protein